MAAITSCPIGPHAKRDVHSSIKNMLNIEIARRFIKIKALILSDYFAKLTKIA
jgi:hypothetical protein